MIPLYYRKIADNISDVKNINSLVRDVDFFEIIEIVMDGSFYGEKNINDLMRHYHRFLIGVNFSLNIVSDH